MIETEHRTVGAAALELASKGDERQSVIETQREMQKNYIEELIKAAQSGEKQFGKSSSFYICVQSRRERLLHNVIRSQFYARQTRPFPDYDLALYHYDPRDEKLSFVWAIPDKETVEMMDDPTYFPSKEEAQLHWFVKSFKKGTLI